MERPEFSQAPHLQAEVSGRPHFVKVGAVLRAVDAQGAEAQVQGSPLPGTDQQMTSLHTPTPFASGHVALTPAPAHVQEGGVGSWLPHTPREVNSWRICWGVSEIGGPATEAYCGKAVCFYQFHNN